MTKIALTTLIPFALLLASCGGGPSTPSVSSAPTVSPSGTGTAGGQVGSVPSTGDQTMSAQEAQILREVNVARAQARSCGGQAFAAAPAVSWNGYLAAAARGHAADMAVRGYFDHTTPEGRTPAQRMEAAGYSNWTHVGENIAAGYTVQNVVQGWIDSPSHCKTLMDPALKELGVGYTYRQGSPYGTYWVQNYGTR